MSDTNYTTNHSPYDEEPVTIKGILKAIATLKDLTSDGTGRRATDPIEVTQEQWDYMKEHFEVRTTPFVFALGVPVILRQE